MIQLVSWRKKQHETTRVQLVSWRKKQHETTRVQEVVFTRSAVCFRFREGAQLFGVDVPQLLQLPLGPTEQILYVHDVLLLDLGVLPELVSDAGDEAWFVPSRLEELAIQGQNLLLHFTVSGHEWFTVTFGLTAEQTKHDDDEDHTSPCFLSENRDTELMLSHLPYGQKSRDVQH